ncbi:MAG TPA: sigma-70 family RNA polymerase sigma factor [Planctomycetaceae bacterium]|nr:sigma-70 family RNA polymerase sigma factor [Planctomycetaceae bacterium]
MSGGSGDSEDLVQQATRGDPQALGAVFDHYRDRLWQMVRIRMDRRVQGRVNPSDVLQEAFVDVARRIGEYSPEASPPFFLWVRQLVGQRLIDIHRQHLGARMRDASLEVSLNAGGLPQATSASLAAQLLGRWTSASRALERAEAQLAVQEALDALEPVDREILVLRHFEMLSNLECAELLGLTKGAASKRYVRALVRIKDVLRSFPGFEEDPEPDSP